MPQEVASGVYQLGLGAVNVFFVEDDEGGLWLVDAGTEPGAERIGGGLRALGRAPQELRGVVVTHLHGDHVGGLAAVKAHTGAEVWAQAEDAAALREGVRGRALEPGPGLVRSADRARDGRQGRARAGDPIAVEHEVDDGETLPFGATALHTPGHTAGHLALLLPRDGGVLFAGDAATNFLRLGVGPDLRGRRRGDAQPRAGSRPAVRDGAVRARAAAAPRAPSASALASALSARPPPSRGGDALSLPKNHSLTPARRDVS